MCSHGISLGYAHDDPHRTGREHPSTAGTSGARCRPRPAGRSVLEALEALFDDAVRDTIERFEATGSPVITDGEQRKQSFATYPVAGLANLAPGGVTIPFVDGHARQLPLLTAGPFRYATPAWSYLDGARPHTSATAQAGRDLGVGGQPHVPAGRPSPGYSREAFVDDLVAEAVAEIRRLPRPGRQRPDRLHRGPALAQARSVEGAARLRFVDLNNRVLAELTDDERARVGVHTCPGGDRTRPTAPMCATRSCCRRCSGSNVANFYVQLASESDRPRVLEILGTHATGDRRIFVGVIDPHRSAGRDGRRGPRPGPRGGDGTSTPSTSAQPMTAASRRSATTRRHRVTSRLRRSSARVKGTALASSQGAEV